MSYIGNNKIEYIEKVYAGWLGKMIGVRHGANIEGWTYDQIQKTYGEIDEYIVDFKNFASDDDINGPLFFQRALDDSQCSCDITADEMGKTWLNYIPHPNLPGVFLWFGGYGISTEHTAYMNMINGIKPPYSGSIEQNGPAVAEQIGGQIFSDCWGLIAPGNPELAAGLAEKMASVSHDGNGIYGGRFIAAAISLAFVETSIETIVDKALSCIPIDCEYRVMSCDIIRFYREDSQGNWRNCFRYIFENYGYDKYPGNCHIIPNAAIVVMGLLYSKGDYSRGVNISNMAGWDTDCNVGNIGTILGVLNGVDGIDSKWKKPIGDFVCCSSVIGSLNIMDIPWMASDTCRLGFSLSGTEIPHQWKRILQKKSLSCHFEYPGSTHAVRGETENRSEIIFENSTEQCFSGKRSLKITIPFFQTASSNRIYLKTYYKSDDFNDSRYNPSFSPVFYPGGSFSAQFLLPESELQNGEEVRILPYCTSIDGERLYGDTRILKAGEWNSISWTVSSDIAGIEEIGFDLRSIHTLVDNTENSASPKIFFIDEFEFSDAADFMINTSEDLVIDRWTWMHKTITQFVKNRGIWDLEEGMLTGSYPHSTEPGDIYTGNYYWKDYCFSAVIRPITGRACGMSFRVNGAMTGYLLHLEENNRLVLKKNNYGILDLAEVLFSWEHGNDYKFQVIVKGSEIIIQIDNRILISYTDDSGPFLSGCIGFSVIQGRMGIREYEVKT